MLSIACVLRSGGCYTTEYVRRLSAGVRTHLSLAHRFVCLSDVADVARIPGVERVPLLTPWPGWLAKLELFRPGLFPTGEPVLYLDLDTVVVGSLDEIAGHPHRFSMLTGFYRDYALASGVMAWSGGRHHIFELFSEELVARYHRWHPAYRGDGGWIERQLHPPADRLQELFPGQIVSRKLRRTRNPDERLVCYHGRPRPHETGWST